MTIELPAESFTQPCVARRFAVTPCGVRSEHDYDVAVADKAVAEHYRLNNVMFDEKKAVVIAQPSRMYVSAKYHERIGWLRYRIHVPVGEAIYLVNAANGLYMRKGCGNLLSYKSPGRGFLAEQPTVEQMEEGAAPEGARPHLEKPNGNAPPSVELAALPLAAPGMGGATGGPVPGGEGPAATPNRPAGGGIPIVPIPFWLCCGEAGGGGVLPPPIVVIPPGRTLPTPEPAVFKLMAVGAVAVILLVLIRRGRRID